MLIFEVVVLIVAGVVVIAALGYTRNQFAGNKHIIDQFNKNGSIAAAPGPSTQSKP